MNARVGSLRPRLPAVVTLCVLAAAAVPVRAQEPAGETRVHVVKRGDTLWDIAHTYLGNAFSWPKIYQANKRLIRNPHWIYPGQRFTILPTGEIVVADTTAAAPQEEEKQAPSDRTRFWHPPAPDTSTVAGNEPRPVVDRGEYLGAPWLGEVASGQLLGHVVDRVSVQQHADVLPQLALLEDQVYVRSEPGALRPAAGVELLVVRRLRQLAPYGTVLAPTAVVRVERTRGDVAVVRLVRQYGPVLPGQLLLPLPSFTPPAPVPAQPVARGVEGELIAFLGEQPLHTTTELAFVTLGRRQGMEVGDELVAYAPARPAPTEKGAELPPQDVARLLVVKVTEQASTVRVIGLDLPGLQPGQKVRLVARIP